MAATLYFIQLSLFFSFMQGIHGDFSNGTFGGANERILSRRKRFLIFPEGSSVQLVFCTTIPLISSLGDIVQWGYTSALAYELPQDPYSPFNHHADPLHRRVDKKVIYFTNEEGKIIDQKPYKKKFIVNPAFAKRSVDGGKTVEFKKEFKIDRKQMHASADRHFLKSERMDSRSIEFHKTTRAALYRKVETMLQGLGGSGRECMLKTLCLVGQARHLPQGSFFQEILRAVFTLPDGENEDPEISEYYKAHFANGSCDELYHGCLNQKEISSLKY